MCFAMVKRLLLPIRQPLHENLQHYFKGIEIFVTAMTQTAKAIHTTRLFSVPWDQNTNEDFLAHS